MDRYPDQWIQLVGNWEARHLGGPGFEKRKQEIDPLNATGRKTLQRWAATDHARIAVAVRSARGTPVLATHAGLSFEFWSQELEGTTDVADAAQRLNALLHDDRSTVFRTGKMYSPSRSGEPVGPVWARAGDEVWASWIGQPMPFGQIHGHTSPYFWGQNRWSAEVVEDLKKRARLFRKQRHVWFDQGDHHIVGIDPGLGIRPRGDELWACRLT